MLFQDDLKIKIHDIMTKKVDLVTAPFGISLEEAKKILHQNRIEKLPLIDSSGKLKGLITSKDYLRKIFLIY